MGIEDKMVAWGEYPAGYNAKVHGPYDPARFYGKADTALADVKLAELPSWLMRRQIGLSPAAGAVSRAFWRWQHKYVQPKKVGIAPFLQIAVGSMIIFYCFNYGKLSKNYFFIINFSIQLIIFFFQSLTVTTSTTGKRSCGGHANN